MDTNNAMTDTVAEVESAESTLKNYDRSDPAVHFALPRHPTVRQQLQYFSNYVDHRFEPLYLRLWYSAIPLLGQWECEVLPDVRVNLETLTDPDVATVVMWVGQSVLDHMEALEHLPKA